MKIHASPQNVLRAFRWSGVDHLQSFHRHASSINFLALRNDLLSRPANVIHDYLTPMNSQLLNTSLAGFLPRSCLSPSFSAPDSSLSTLHNRSQAVQGLLPLGHHLVYFPTQTTNDLLLPDGTDILQFPGEPFTRRLWAGGSLHFENAKEGLLRRGNDPVFCVEKIRDVEVRGKNGNENIWVHIERQYMQSLKGGSGNAISETRSLVFLRPKTPEEALQNVNAPPRQIQARQKSECFQVLSHSSTDDGNTNG
jgi:hydroxyacyl-ACP dehydratase HTD2-like protein with hotdog domain